MSLLKNSSPASVKKPSQIWDHMPRRRKRHSFNNRMMLMLLLLLMIFFNCCSTLILSSTDVQAKDLNDVTFKGSDRQSNQHFGTGNVLAKGEDYVSKDATNDNGNFERIQVKKSENQNDYGDDDDDDEVDGRSSEVIEMIQPSHTLRHQEHYKQQQKKQQQQQQQQYHYTLKKKTKEQHEYQHEQQWLYDDNTDDAYDYDDDDDDDNNDDVDDVADDIKDDSEHIRHLRYQQIQEALREPITPPTTHHRRHEHHLENKQLTKQTEFKWPQHHLRHQHHQHKELSNNRQPQLRNLNHEMTKQNLTNHLSQTISTKTLHQRYFDRESSYPNPSMLTTEGPRLRHSGYNSNFIPTATYEYLNNPYNNRLLNEDANTNSNQMEDIKRFSLSLDANENAKKHNPINKNILLSSTLKDVADYDVNEYVNDNAADKAIDDYSYEDDDKKELNSRSKYSSIASTNAKTNVKRYTNPLTSLYKLPLRNQHVEVSYDDYENEDDIEVNHNKSSSSISPPASSSNISDEPLNDNDDDKFSDEKWNKIEYEHYRKQLQHQRAMQALRSHRPINDNSLPSHRYSSYPAPSLDPTSTTYNNNGWTKRQTVINDDEDNIYSRYYVPGSMTRKKEEELGSPTAILESRRQYAMQQRQNKALASAHHRRIVTEGSCRLPQPRIERIRKDSWKIYTPHCTILHRCADDAGCCPSERQTCAPKRTKNVDLYFFVISLNETQGSIEKLTFINHTECHCVDRSKQRAPEYGNSRSKELVTNNQIPFLRRATILNCYCPNLFEKILQEDGYCRCDCSSGNMGCDWLKRGMEHFSMNDRKCIIEGRCKLPTCEYGQYIKKHGRCPRREDRHLSADVDW